MTALLVVAGAVVGAPARYVTDLLVQSRHDSKVPWGTFTVNVVGSFVLGVVAALVAGGHGGTWAQALLGTGFCGALTTFSTFSFETLRLIEDGRARTAVLNVVLSLVAGFGAVCLGWWLGSLA
ncbi:fluoride efflux transporter CrcB [Nocardioides sp. Kera G14]|uniref:fluoride efflux transporter CrcB n=1 Tax=Nocardioides sp. Kera G14 TaxID=2884264 RepID=UPI001D123AA2|nr:fluoride efflux transporter CrcB [Nocardioides sp. Kera G14]UDY24033.1 fluoride efflux transporter CrcB [Nocardioides sp. Kera G14]